MIEGHSMAFNIHDHKFRKTANMMICLVSGFPQEDDEGQSLCHVGRHEETNLNGMQKARTWCSIQMSNIFIVFCNLELLTSVPQPITVPVMQSN